MASAGPLPSALRKIAGASPSPSQVTGLATGSAVRIETADLDNAHFRQRSRFAETTAPAPVEIPVRAQIAQDIVEPRAIFAADVERA